MVRAQKELLEKFQLIGFPTSLIGLLMVLPQMLDVPRMREVLSFQCLQPICMSVNLVYLVQSFPIWPHLCVAQIPGGLVHCFEDEVADLEAAVLCLFVEVLRYFLFVSGHF